MPSTKKLNTYLSLYVTYQTVIFSIIVYHKFITSQPRKYQKYRKWKPSLSGTFSRDGGFPLKEVTL